MAEQQFEAPEESDFTSNNFDQPEATAIASTDPATVPGEKINATRNDDDERKIFVGGLSWETTVKDLREYFEHFGEITDCTLKTDPNTGRSRGFGFVQFDTANPVEKVIAQETHTLHGRHIDPKRAKARGGREPIKKVFVGGLDPEIPESEIREYFEKFGKIEEIDLPFDKQKNQRRAFCFITFETEAVVDQVVASPKQTIRSKEVDVKKATPKNDQGYNGNWGNGNYNYDYYGQGYGNYGNYDYNNYYGNYDYNNYYNQGGWGNQGYGNYGNYGSYDYSGWYGNQQGGNQQGPNGTGNGQYKQKSVRGGGGQQGAGYHPYQR